jgi:hypothetical protein
MNGLAITAFPQRDLLCLRQSVPIFDSSKTGGLLYWARRSLDVFGRIARSGERRLVAPYHRL